MSSCYSIINNKLHVQSQLPEVSYTVSNEEDIFDHHSLVNQIARVAKVIFAIILPPLGLALLIGKIINYAITKDHILPALRFSKAKLDEKRAQFLSNPLHEARCQRSAIQTVDGVKLDTMIINHPLQQHLPPNNQKFIIFFNDYQDSYETMAPNLIKLSDQTDASIYAFNYRGVGRSEGFPTKAEDLMKDGEALVQRLFSQGIHPANILIQGSGLGAAIGAHVAALHQEPGYEMNYCGDRTFSSLTEKVKAISRLMKNQIINKKMACSKIKINHIALKTRFLLAVLYVFGWNFKTFESYKEINGHKFIIYHRNDPVIPYSISLYRKLKIEQMTIEQRMINQARQLEKIRAKLRGKVYIGENVAKPYKPKNAIQLDPNLERNLVHSLPIVDSLQLEDYKAHVIQAFS